MTNDELQRAIDAATERLGQLSPAFGAHKILGAHWEALLKIQLERAKLATGSEPVQIDPSLLYGVSARSGSSIIAEDANKAFRKKLDEVPIAPSRKPGCVRLGCTARPGAGDFCECDPMGQR